MTEPLPVFLGWDSRECAAYDVAHWSIARRASRPVLVTPLRLDNLRSILSRPVEQRDGKLWCPISEAPMATEFAISRFCVPFMQRKGWALFADCDVLALGDIADLFAIANDRYAVMVVKHDQWVKDGETKMDGQVQTAYTRKNWSSVVLWNCGHHAHNRLTPFMLNTAPGRDLHRFCWLEDEEIGELPIEWNWLVGVPKNAGDVQPKLLHLTLGGPWFEGWKPQPWDEVWLHEQRMLSAYMVGREKSR